VQTVSFSVDGYSDLTEETIITAGLSTNMGQVALSSNLGEGEYRVVLTWAPDHDVDYHAYTPEDEHVFYYHTIGNGISLDAQSWHEGPETVTITSQLEGDYMFWAYNWSRDALICDIGARFQIYDEAGLIGTVNVPTEGCNEDSYAWKAFSLNGSVVTLINTFGTDEPDL
jgi:hypothetical protein